MVSRLSRSLVEQINHHLAKDFNKTTLLNCKINKLLAFNKDHSHKDYLVNKLSRHLASKPHIFRLLKPPCLELIQPTHQSECLASIKQHSLLTLRFHRRAIQSLHFTSTSRQQLMQKHLTSSKRKNLRLVRYHAYLHPESYDSYTRSCNCNSNIEHEPCFIQNNSNIE